MNRHVRQLRETLARFAPPRLHRERTSKRQTFNCRPIIVVGPQPEQRGTGELWGTGNGPPKALGNGELTPLRVSGTGTAVGVSEWVHIPHYIGV